MEMNHDGELLVLEIKKGFEMLILYYMLAL